MAGNQACQKTRKKKRRRPSKSTIFGAQPANQTPSKRQKIASNDNDDSLVLTTPLPSNLPPLNATVGILRPDVSAYRPSSATMHNIMSEKYEAAVGSILRPSQGIFLSRAAQRYKRRDDPASVTTRSYQIAIFKLAALHELSWFIGKDSVLQPGRSKVFQIQEQSNNAQDIASVDLDHSRPRDAPGCAENPPSAPLRAHNLHESQEQGIFPQAGAIPSALVTPQNEAKDLDRPAVAIGSSRSTLFTELHPHTGLSAAPRLSERPSPILTKPAAGEVCATQTPPELGIFVHRDPLLQTRSVSSGPSKIARVVSSSTPPTQTRKDRLAPAEGSLDNAASYLDSDNDLSFGSHVQSLDDITNNSSSVSRKQHPANYIFRLSGLKNLYWFRNDSSIDKGNILTHADAQEVVSPLGAKPDQVPGIDVSRSNGSYYKASAIDEQSSSVTDCLPVASKSSGSGRSGRKGGSTAILRRDIVLDLVHKCGGVFPEAGAMRAPFGREWKARGQPGLPDRNTVIHAVNVCCEQGKLRRIVFSFKDRYGITNTSTIFALPEIGSRDPKITETQEMIKQRHPQTFVPDAAIAKDPQEEIGDIKRQQIMKEATEKRARIDEARTMASKPPEEREAYIAALQSFNYSEQEKMALSRLVEPSARKIQRLSTIRNPSAPTSSSYMSTEVQSYEMQPSGRFPRPSQDLALSQERLEAGRLTQPTSSFYGILHPSRPSKEQYDEFLDQSKQSRQRIRELANRVAQIERNQISKSSDGQYPRNGDFAPYQSAPREHTVSRHNDSLDRQLDASGLFLAGSPEYPFDEAASKPFVGSRKRKHLEDDDFVFPGFMDPVHTYHRTTGTFSASFPGFRIGIIILNQRGKRRYHQKAAIAVGYQSPFPLRALGDETSLSPQQPDDGSYVFPGVMSPDVFHSSSGTFSALFLGFRPIMTEATKARASRKRGRPKSQRTQTATDAEAFAAVENSSRRNTKRRRRESTIESSREDWTVIENLSQRNTKRRRRDSGKERTQEDLTVIENIDRGDTTRRRRKSIVEGNTFNESAEPSVPLTASPVRLRRVRGPQTASTMGEDGALRLFVAVTVVRVLTGGLRRNIDWALVAKVFAPEYDEAFLQSRWSSVLAKMRHHHVRMDADFQKLFARAYEEGMVPKLDFEHLNEYDWKWLVEWTMTHLDTPANTAPELLMDR